MSDESRALIERVKVLDKAATPRRVAKAKARIAELEAENARLREAGAKVLLTFADWPAYSTTTANGERRAALDVLVTAIDAARTKEGQ